MKNFFSRILNSNKNNNNSSSSSSSSSNNNNNNNNSNISSNGKRSHNNNNNFRDAINPASIANYSENQFNNRNTNTNSLIMRSNVPELRASSINITDKSSSKPTIFSKASFSSSFLEEPFQFATHAPQHQQNSISVSKNSIVLNCKLDCKIHQANA